MYLHFSNMEYNVGFDHDPIVGYRQAKNKLSLNYRQSALNAEGLRVMRMLMESSDIISSRSDEIKVMILSIYEEMCETSDDESSDALSIFMNAVNNSFDISDSSEESSTIDLNYTPQNGIDFDTDDKEDNEYYNYEDMITSLSLLYESSLHEIHILHEEMFQFSILRQSDID